MSDWNSERVRALVSAAENAVQRTRWNFLVLILGCVVMITSQLNLYGTWVRNVRDRQNAKVEQVERAEQAAQTEQDKKHAEQNKKEEAAVLSTIDKIMWDDLYTVSMPLLGIKYSADDLIVLGTASMSILALWFVYAHRRENHCIGVLRDIANDAKTKDRALASYIHAAVAHYFVFTTTTLNDKPYTMMKNENRNNQGTKSVLRWHVIALTQLPWLASLMAVIVMCVSMFVKLKLVPLPDPQNPSPLFFQMASDERIEAIGRMVWGLAFTILTMFYCVRAQQFDRDTHEMLREMENAASGD